ncbi:MAG: hypothetical protein D6679_14365 [Candidatus Hydrogenedentota bacterium]|nr:MAG: hypothetical protein D6679_14365 [Candidatus Hydrogenedentota bacterium]
MSLSEKIRVFLRLHAVQFLWNFKGMQNVGFYYAILPALRRIYAGDSQGLEQAQRRHFGFFNTHPYFAPICVGVSIKLEEDLRAGKGKPEMIPVLKNRMSGPLAAVGDAFFWETVRPTVGALAALSVYALGLSSASTIRLLLLLWILYVLPVEWLRWQGLSWGYLHGFDVVKVLKERGFQKRMKRLRTLGMFLLGGVTVGFVMLYDDRIFLWCCRAGIAGLLVLLTLRKVSPTFQLYILILVALLVSYLGTMAGLV